MRAINQMKRPALLAVMAVLMCGARAASAQDEPRFTPAQLRADLSFVKQAIATTHPDPDFSVDPVRLAQAYEQIDAQLREPLTRDQAWRLLATLNPVFASCPRIWIKPAAARHAMTRSAPRPRCRTCGASCTTCGCSAPLTTCKRPPSTAPK